MRFLLYCRELRAAGGRSVGVGLLKALARTPSVHEVIAVVPDDPEYRSLEGGAVRLIVRPSRGGAHVLLGHRQLRQELRRIRPDALFMLGNFGLADPPCPQAVYVHNPFLLYPESPVWRLCPRRELFYLRVRNAVMGRGLRHAGAVVSQTPVMLERIHRLFGIPHDRLALIPNSITAAVRQPQGETTASRQMRATDHALRALCMARYQVQKNIDVLLAVADYLLACGRSDVGLFVTVDPAHDRRAGRFLRAAGRYGRDAVLHNLGEVPMGKVPSCYRAADALLLPTLLESFTGTFIDAINYGVPVITSDLDFARIVCGDAARYVDPTSAASIVAALNSLTEERAEWQERTAAATRRAEALFVDWDTIARKVVDLLERLARRERLPDVLDEPWMHEVRREPEGPSRVVSAGARASGVTHAC